jgi:hypothetical protein
MRFFLAETAVDSVGRGENYFSYYIQAHKININWNNKKIISNLAAFALFSKPNLAISQLAVATIISI